MAPGWNHTFSFKHVSLVVHDCPTHPEPCSPSPPPGATALMSPFSPSTASVSFSPYFSISCSAKNNLSFAATTANAARRATNDTGTVIFRENLPKSAEQSRAGELYRRSVGARPWPVPWPRSTWVPRFTAQPCRGLNDILRGFGRASCVINTLEATGCFRQVCMYLLLSFTGNFPDSFVSRCACRPARLTKV